METQRQPAHLSTATPASVPAWFIEILDHWDFRFGSWYAHFVAHRPARVLGRMLTALLLTMLMSAQAIAVSRVLRDAWPALADLNIWMTALHHLLQSIFLGIAVLLVVVRRPAQTGTVRFSGIVVALTGAFSASLLVADSTGGLNAELLPLAVPLLVLGMTWAIWSLRTLGRCFSILPEVRGLVISGPYRWVRHPVYLGEMVAVLGLLLPILSTRNVIVFVLFCALQLWRARHEEAGLAATFPEYDEYRQHTARLLPGLW